LLNTSHPEGEEGNGNPLCFFCFAGARSSELAKRIRSRPAPRSIERGNPKGAGLEGSREASYAITVRQQSKKVSVRLGDYSGKKA
jgi:hypothetical protein